MLEDLKYWVDDNKWIVKLVIFIALVFGGFQWRGHCVKVYEEQQHPDSIRNGLIFILENIPSNWTDTTERKRYDYEKGGDGVVKKYHDYYKNENENSFKVQKVLYKGDTVTTIEQKSLSLPFHYLEVEVKRPVAFLSIPKKIDYEATFETIEPEKTLKRKGAQNALEYTRAKGLRCRFYGDFDAKTKILTAELHLNSLSVYHLRGNDVFKAKYLGDGQFEIIE